MVNTNALLPIVFLHHLDLKQLQVGTNDRLLATSTISRSFLQLQGNLLTSQL